MVPRRWNWLPRPGRLADRFNLFHHAITQPPPLPSLGITHMRALSLSPMSNHGGLPGAGPVWQRVCDGCVTTAPLSRKGAGAGRERQRARERQRGTHTHTDTQTHRNEPVHLSNPAQGERVREREGNAKGGAACDEMVRCATTRLPAADPRAYTDSYTAPDANRRPAASYHVCRFGAPQRL